MSKRVVRNHTTAQKLVAVSMAAKQSGKPLTELLELAAKNQVFPTPETRKDAEPATGMEALEKLVTALINAVESDKKLTNKRYSASYIAEAVTIAKSLSFPKQELPPEFNAQQEAAEIAELLGLAEQAS